MKRIDWKHKELNLIENLYGKISTKHIQTILKETTGITRSINSIQRKAGMLQIREKRGITRRNIDQIMYQRIIKTQIENGHLKI